MRTTQSLFPRTVAAVALSALLTGGPAAADDLVRYSVDASTAGLRGDDLIYHSYAASRSRFNYQTNSVFWDSSVNGTGAVVMIAKNGDNQIDPATDEEQAGSDTHELVVGLSDDGGENFAFHRVLKWKQGGRMVRVSMVPDPDRDEVWVGIAQFWGNLPNSVKEDFIGNTRLEIDWGQERVRLLDQDGVGWDEYDFGKVDPPQPGFYNQNGGLLFTHLAEVTIGGEVRYEAWASVPVAPEPNNKPTPCESQADYDWNTDHNDTETNDGWDGFGRRIVYYLFDPEDGVDLGSGKTINALSSVRSLPTSYQRSDQHVIRGQLFGEDFLYVGNQDQIVCRAHVSSNSGGSSVRFIKLLYNATLDNYTEVEHDYVIDISAAGGPNWTCEDSRVRCTSSNLNHYANVNAVPYFHENADRVQLYVGAWGTKAPSLPAIGQAGHVTVSETPVTVTLDVKLENPVVFVQPPSYDQATPVIARVSDVGDNGTKTTFKVRLQTDSAPSSPHGFEKLSYIVLEAGTYRLADKKVLEVAKMSTSQTSPNGTATWTSTLDLDDSHDDYTGALVFTQLQTMNDSYYAKTRHYGPPTVVSPTRCHFGRCTPMRLAKVDFGIERDQASQNNGLLHGWEEVGVLLIGEKWIGRSSSVFGLGPWGAKGFTTGRVSGVAGIVNAGWKSITFEQPRGTGGLNNPVLFAWTETKNGTDPTNVRYDKNSLTTTGVDLAVDEDVSHDMERNHTGETIVYWVLGRGSKLIRAQPIEPVYDTLY